MRLIPIAAAAAALMSLPVLLSGPTQAKTATQLWAQGRGAYVDSKYRIDTWQDDLAGYGYGYAPRRAPYRDRYAPPPPPPGYDGDYAPY